MVTDLNMVVMVVVVVAGVGWGDGGGGVFEKKNSNYYPSMKNTKQHSRGLGSIHGSSRSSSPSLASESDATPSLSAGEQVQINLSSLDSTACADLTKQFSCQSSIKRRLSEDMKKTYPKSAGLDAVMLFVHVQFHDLFLI